MKKFEQGDVPTALVRYRILTLPHLYGGHVRDIVAMMNVLANRWLVGSL